MRLRAPLLAVLAAVLLGAGGCPPAPPTGRLLLDDTFSGSTLDGARWGTCHWWAQPGEGCTILTNDELEWYVPQQVTVSHRALRLTARPGRTEAHGRTFPYVSGMVSSGRPGDEPTDRPRFALTYGRVEVRFRVPRGAGLWPAIWMLPTTNEALPEIDLLEVHGDEPDLPAFTLHDADGGRHRRHARTADLSTGLHTVRLDWSRDRLQWSLDGTVVHTVTGAAVPRQAMYLVMNLAVGGDAGTPSPSTAFPATFVVDRVQVWAAP